jgi:hypothetical protein
VKAKAFTADSKPSSEASAWFTVGDRHANPADPSDKPSFPSDPLPAPANPPPSSTLPTPGGVLDLTWTDSSDNEDGFKLERKTGTTGTFAQVAVVGPNTTSYTDSGLTVGITYCYRVNASNAAGDSTYSNEVCAVARVP